MAMPAYRSSDVRLNILFQGQAEFRLYILSAAEFARFETEYRRWQQGASGPTEFVFLQNGKQIALRFDPILERESLTQADWALMQHQSWSQALMALCREPSYLSLSEV